MPHTSPYRDPPAGQDDEPDIAAINSAIIAMMPDGVVVMDFSMTIRMCNPAMEHMFGWAPGSLLGEKISVLIPERYRPAHGANISTFAQGQVDVRTMGNRNAHTHGVRKDGTEIALGISIMKHHTASGPLFFALIRDRSEWVRESTELERLANTDPLSGLPDRRAFTHAVERALEDGQEQMLSVVMVDLDHFKAVNDRHGHEGGDCIIRTIPEVLHRTVRTSDLIARWGGEEFIILLTGASEDVAMGIAERLRKTVEETAFMMPDGRAHRITASLGVVVCNTQRDGLAAIVQRADRAMYAAKKSGRNTVNLYRDDADWSI